MKKYGGKLANQMKRHIKGATVTIRKDGRLDIPESDICLAYKIVKRKRLHPFEWD